MIESSSEDEDIPAKKIHFEITNSEEVIVK